MSTFLVVNNSSIACETTASEPYLKVNNNGYLPLVTESGTYTYTSTSTRTSESTYESVESDVAGYSGSTTIGVASELETTIEIRRITSETNRRATSGGRAYDYKSTQSIYMIVDGVGNNSVTFTYMNTSAAKTATYKLATSISSSKNTISRTNWPLNYSTYKFASVAVSQDSNMVLAENYSSFSDTYLSSTTISGSQYVGIQGLYTRVTSHFDTLTGYKYSELLVTETFLRSKSMPNVQNYTYSDITFTLTDTFTVTVTETITKRNIPLLTNSSGTYYLKG
jgi:hypothetical protein